MAQIPLASLDIDAWSIPHDLVALLHKGETVQPTSFASGYRSAVSGGGQSGGNTHLTVNFTANGRFTADEIRSNAQLIARTVASYINDNPTARPKY